MPDSCGVICGKGESGGEHGGKGGEGPYGGDGHNVADATQGTSPLYPLASHNADADNIFKWCFQTGLLSHLDN